MNLYMDVIIAGFGDQGVMLIGNLLAYAAMEQGLNITYIAVSYTHLDVDKRQGLWLCF